jgi:hypothetical protein
MLYACNCSHNFISASMPVAQSVASLNVDKKGVVPPLVPKQSGVIDCVHDCSGGSVVISLLPLFHGSFSWMIIPICGITKCVGADVEP